MPARDSLCQSFEETVPDLVREGASAVSGSELLRHAESCATCAVTLRRERALQARFDAPCEAPERLLVLPDLGAADGRHLRRVRFLWAAGAAAAALLVAVWVAAPPRGTGAGAAGDTAVLRILDDTNPFPAWDERLVGLAAGAEQMASIRPAEDR